MREVKERQCSKCRRKKEQRHKPTMEKPSSSQLEEWRSEGYAYATDGCLVKRDGICEHGHDSWLIELGMI